MSLDISESRKSLKLHHRPICQLTVALESTHWITSKKKRKEKERKKKARSNIYVTSHICSCNYFPVCFWRRRKPDRTGIQQWITIHRLEISSFSEVGKNPRLTADPQRVAMRTTEESNAWLRQRVYRSLTRKEKLRRISPVNFLRAYVAPHSTTMPKSPARLSCCRRGKLMST